MERRKQVLLGMALATCVVGIAQAIQAVNHTAAVELDFTPRTSAAYWASGFLAEYSRAIGGATPTVWLFDRDGNQVTPPTAISFPDAPSAEIHTVTADSSGTLYASAEAWAGSGGGTGVICRIPRGGKSVQIIRTGYFVAVALAATKAGEIWAFGLPLVLQTARSTDAEYMTMWKFDASGRVADKFLPRSTFGKGLVPSHAFGDVGTPRLVANGTRVGLYSATANRWMEFDAVTGSILADIHVPRPKAQDGSLGSVNMVAMTETGDVYAHCGYRTATNEGSGFYQLDKAASSWIRLAAPICDETFSNLFGVDGNSLIVRYGPGTSHSWTFAWIDAKGFRRE